MTGPRSGTADPDCDCQGTGRWQQLIFDPVAGRQCMAPVYCECKFGRAMRYEVGFGTIKADPTEELHDLEQWERETTE